MSEKLPLVLGSNGCPEQLQSGDTLGGLPTILASETVSTLLGRGSSTGTGASQEITLGTNLTISGTTLNATSGGGVTEEEAIAYSIALG